MTLYRTKRHRLSEETYLGSRAVSFTVCERNKRLVFDDKEIFSALSDLNNPVRAGIVKNWKEYYFKGSTIYDFDEWD